MRAFDKKTKEILEAFGTPINVVGSMRERGTVRYPSDFDQFQVIDVQSTGDALEFIKNAVKNLSKTCASQKLNGMTKIILR